MICSGRWACPPGGVQESSQLVQRRGQGEVWKPCLKPCEGLMPPGALRAPRGPRQIRGLSWAPSTHGVLWCQQQQALLRTDTNFPLFMLLQDSHSFQI